MICRPMLITTLLRPCGLREQLTFSARGATKRAFPTRLRSKRRPRSGSSIHASNGKVKKTPSVADYANLIAEKGGFRLTTWREGSKNKLSALFAARRVLPIATEGVNRPEAETVWLLTEWENGEPKPNKFYFINAPKFFSTRQLVRQVEQRWRTERAYEDLKGQLGLDHFEGRRYRGRHHHLSVALCCYAFIVAEQARLFPRARGEISALPAERGAAEPDAWALQ